MERTRMMVAQNRIIIYSHASISRSSDVVINCFHIKSFGENPWAKPKNLTGRAMLFFLFKKKKACKTDGL